MLLGFIPASKRGISRVRSKTRQLWGNGPRSKVIPCCRVIYACRSVDGSPGPGLVICSFAENNPKPASLTFTSRLLEVH